MYCRNLATLVPINNRPLRYKTRQLLKVKLSKKLIRWQLFCRSILKLDVQAEGQFSIDDFALAYCQHRITSIEVIKANL